ncbi:MAG TPA: hypothetical protein VFS21_33705 [Roseiflexaceae bacterium]|nr:hypothetical protein [Roseiflexaceae bacterium]
MDPEIWDILPEITDTLDDAAERLGLDEEPEEEDEALLMGAPWMMR